MRRSPIREMLSSRGASFVERVDAELAMRFSSFEEEYRAVREGVGLADFSFAARFQIPEDGFEVFERYAAGAVANIRFGRVLHTVATDYDGFVESDLYIANDDENLLLIGESLVDNQSTTRTLENLGGAEVGLEDISESTALFSLDGHKAWSVVKDMFGTDVLGLPYLSLEAYDLDGIQVKLLRAGKTSEFGYLFLVPAKEAASIWEKIERAGEPYGIKSVGLETHLALRLDGRFFNIHEEGAKVRDPLPLGLQWMIDFEGDDFRGRDAILKRRGAGLQKKIIGVIPGKKGEALEVGSQILHRGEVVAEVITACDSPALGSGIGLALFELEYAYSGLELEGSGGQSIRTITMPPFIPKSLTVKLDEM